MTTEAIVNRNRENAKLSTGPRSAAGKLAARRNALKHGLTANPAAIGGEHADLFNILHDQLCCEIKPRGQVEAGLVHRLAVAYWRLNRATEFDGAMSSGRVDRIRKPRQDVQKLIQDFHECFEWREVQERDPVKLASAYRVGLATKGKPWIRLKRVHLHHLDAMRAARRDIRSSPICAESRRAVAYPDADVEGARRLRAN